LEWGASSVYRGLGEQEEPGAPGGEEVPYTQTGTGTVDMSSPARVRSLAMPSPDGLLLPAHKTLLATSSYSTQTPYKIHQNCDIINWFEVVVKNGKCSEAEIKEASKIFVGQHMEIINKQTIKKKILKFSDQHKTLFRKIQRQIQQEHNRKGQHF
jgi:hypothetical protein